MSKKHEPMVVVGFGKHNLPDMVENLNTMEGQTLLLDAISKHHWPPRYRRVSACTEEEIAAFAEYVNWVTAHLENSEE